MKYSLTTKHIKFCSPDYNHITLEELNDIESISELYLGDVLWKVPNPVKFLTNDVVPKLTNGATIHVESFDIYELASSVLYGSVKTNKLSKILYESDYVRVLSREDVIGIAEKSGFLTVKQDIDNIKYLLTFIKLD